MSSSKDLPNSTFTIAFHLKHSVNRPEKCLYVMSPAELEKTAKDIASRDEGVQKGFDVRDQ